MPSWPYPCVIADIGGTNIRFAQIDSPDTSYDEVAQTIEKIGTADHPDLATAMSRWIERRPATLPRPRSAAVAIATAVTGERTKLTNSDFLIDRPATMAALGLDDMRVLNDFEALAWSLPMLRDEDLQPIGAVVPSRDDNMVVLGPGTGLGCAGLVRQYQRWIPIPGEAGHITQAAANDEESRVLAAARRRFSHVSAERLLSGVGMPTLYASVAEVMGRPVDEPFVATHAPKPDIIVPASRVMSPDPGPDPATIIRTALDGSDPVAVKTIETFCAMLGTLAGNLALVFNAHGGVLIGGGIAGRILPMLQQSAFRERFESKGRYQPVLSRTGTALITHAQPALLGLQHALQA